MKSGRIAGWSVAIFLLFPIVFVIGCRKPSSAASTRSGIEDAPGSNAVFYPIEVTNLVLVTDTEEKEREDLKLEVRALAMAGNFDKLETMAVHFRSHRSRFKNGSWKLRAFYTAFDEYQKITSAKDYADLVSRLNRWASEQPDSITPRLSLAEAYFGYAWQARGAGWADEVTDQGARLMDERIGQSFAWLQAARKLQDREEDPAFYSIALHLCLGTEVRREDYEQIFRAGVHNDPTYTALYEYKAYYLLPRWFGQPGEWETFAREVSKREDIPDHEEIFARIALYLRDLGYFHQEFSGSDQSWEDLKSSFHAVEQDYPDSLEVKSILCLMAAKMCDYKEARVQAKMLNGEVDLSVWGSQTNFVKAVEWMNQDDGALESGLQQFRAQMRQKN